jgi:signal recognition particle receptor subunit beta
MEGLKGVDGVVVVFDSQQARLEASLEALDELESTLAAQDAFLTPEISTSQKKNRAIPWVAQLNKRELLTSLPKTALVEALQLPPTLRIFESIATRADGVLEAFSAIASQVHVHLNSRSQLPPGDGF